MKKFKGVYTALVTPFDQCGNINTIALEKLIRVNLDKGVNGFYVSGSTGESLMLSMNERKQLLKQVTDIVSNSADVIVNVGMFSTEHSIELAKDAEKNGVSAISSVPPFYFPFNMDEYEQYYTDLADATDLPVIVYNIPAMSSVKFSNDDLFRLLSNDKIIGIKHTSYDLFQLEQLINHFPEKSIFIGHDELYLSALAVGVEAGIGSTFNIMAEKFITMNKMFHEGRMKEALAVQNQVNNVVSVLCEVGVFKGVKEILKLQGIDCGDCRKPFKPLNENQKQLLLETAEANGLIH